MRNGPTRFQKMPGQAARSQRLGEAQAVARPRLVARSFPGHWLPVCRALGTPQRTPPRHGLALKQLLPESEGAGHRAEQGLPVSSHELGGEAAQTGYLLGWGLKDSVRWWPQGLERTLGAGHSRQRAGDLGRPGAPQTCHGVTSPGLGTCGLVSSCGR